MSLIKSVFLIIAFSILLINNIVGQGGGLSIGAEFSPTWSRLSGALSDENFIATGHFVGRVEYQSESQLSPTIGIGYLVTGKQNTSDIGGMFGIEKINFRDKYNYVIIPVGINITIGDYFIFPEISVGFNTSNREKQITTFTNGNVESNEEDVRLNSGEFNKLSYPLFLTIGRSFKLEKSILSWGLKAYYGLNQVIRNVPRNNHYYGFGFSLLAKRNMYYVSED